MRILYFSRSYTTHDHRFLSAMVLSGHDIYYLRLIDERHESISTLPMPSRVKMVEWTNKEPYPVHLLTMLPDFERVIADVRPDLIQAGPVQSCGFITALSGFHPFLLMSWGSDIMVDSDKNDVWNWITRYTLQGSDGLLCDCASVRSKVMSLVDYHNPIAQFPWGIDVNAFYPGVSSLNKRHMMGWANAHVLLSTRSLEPIYNTVTLLAAFKKAHYSDSRLRLIMLGDGSLAQDINQYIIDNDLDDLIYRPGRVPYQQLPDYFREADTYISCAESDGSSVSLLEALGTGLPVIVADNECNREWVTDDNGFLAPFANSDIFAEMILRAVNPSKTDLALFATHSRALIREKANWDNNVLRLFDAYEILDLAYSTKFLFTQ